MMTLLRSERRWNLLPSAISPLSHHRYRSHPRRYSPLGRNHQRNVLRFGRLQRPPPRQIPPKGRLKFGPRRRAIRVRRDLKRWAHHRRSRLLRQIHPKRRLKFGPLQRPLLRRIHPKGKPRFGPPRRVSHLRRNHKRWAHHRRSHRLRRIHPKRRPKFGPPRRAIHLRRDHKRWAHHRQSRRLRQIHPKRRPKFGPPRRAIHLRRDHR